MKFENTQIYNFEGAIRGMRNPLASGNKSDSEFGIDYYENLYSAWDTTDFAILDSKGDFVTFVKLGANDLDLAQRLIKGGPEHRKFLRQIQVCVDITAPLYYGKEFDTYKVGTCANSTSTMHKLASTPITLECFETDDYEPCIVIAETENTKYTVEGFVSTEGIDYTLLAFLEGLRQRYLKTQDVRYWKELVRWLPEGWLQTRTVTMNYENLRTICHQRNGHKLTEWASFVKGARTLPYAEELIFYKNCQ